MANTIHQSNLVSALHIAIESVKASEAKIGPDFVSAFRAGLEDNLKELKSGNPLEVVYRDHLLP